MNTIPAKSRRNTLRTAIALCMAMALMASMFVLPGATGAFASIGEKLTNLIQQVYELILKITLPVAVVVLCWSAIKMFMGGQRNMEEAKKMIFVVMLVILIVWLAPVIVQELANAFGNGTTGFNFTVPTVNGSAAPVST